MRLKYLPLILTLVLLTSLLPHASAQSVEALSLTVYPDGYVLVNESVVTANYTVVLSIPLLGKDVEGLVVTDGRGNMLPFEVNGSNVTVYFGNASLIKLSYFTPDLTSKQGAIWNLTLYSPIPVRITLPDKAVIVDLNTVPLQISGNSIVMPNGTVSLSYVIPIAGSTTSSQATSSSSSSSQGTASTSSTSSVQASSSSSGSGTSPSHSTSSNSSSSSKTSSSSPSPSAPPRGSPGRGLWAAVVLGVVVLVAGGAYWYFRRPRGDMKPLGKESLERFRKKIESMEDLNDDEKGALLYLIENGGKAPQSKVRSALGIPKTTAWRMFKRLEERGLVRVYKLGRENWVELVIE
ncbi:helix-turn-helix transcriptional regulator [Thermococcus sp.]